MNNQLEEQNASAEFILRPIGRISAGGASSWLWVDPPYRDGLAGLRPDAQLEVLWWLDGCDNASDRARLRCGENGERGVFATHAPHRPNPIALSRVSIQAVDAANGLVKVDPMDAKDGSPLLDLKSSPAACPT